MPILAFFRRQASTKVISEPPLSSLTHTTWLDVYKNSVTFFCVMCFTEWWSPNMVNSSGWTSGGSTAQRLIGRVTGLCLVVIFRTVFWERSDHGWQLSSSSSRQLFGQVACLCLGDVNSEDQTSLQRQRCVRQWHELELVWIWCRALPFQVFFDWPTEPVVKLKLQRHFTGNHFHLNDALQMVDRPNTTPIGQDKKTLTFKVLLYLFLKLKKCSLHL